MTDDRGHEETVHDEPVYDDLPDGEHAARPGGKRALARLDRMLDKIRRRNGGGNWFWGFLKWSFLLFVVAPFLWVFAYGFIESPGTILMVQRSMQGQDVRRTPVKLDEISPHLVRAVIAAEDSKFCRHDGFDTEAIQAALKANERSANQAKGKVRGGSTISQQTAKNLFLWPHRDWVRKGAEAYFTALTELMWPKKRIMEAYLNAAEWGDGLFGAEAAAQARFGVSAKNLTARQASLLASVLPSPNKWSADKPGPYVRRRAASIEARMYVLRNEGLDLCVLDAGATPPPKRTKPVEPEDVLPPLEELPPSIVEEDQPIPSDQPPAEGAPPADSLDGQVESDAEPTAPADAPGLEPANAPPSGGGPLDISPGN
jgi:monofunctional glycosyltransferase